MSRVFVDTNPLFYAVDDAVPAKRDRAQAWLRTCWQRRCGRLSTQVTHDFYANARERFAGSLTPAQTQAEVRRYQPWKPWLIDQATVETAWAVESRYGLSYWDARMLAAAQHLGCAWLLTEDLQHNQQLDTVRVLNPFFSAPEVLDAGA